MSPDQAKAPEKVALISLFFLETSVTLRIPKANDSLLLDAVWCRFGARTTRGILSEGDRKKYTFLMSVYLYWETRNVQAGNTSNILDDNLQMLEFDHGDSIKAYVEQNQCPFEESVNSVG